jgi:hypothetical protein
MEKMLFQKIKYTSYTSIKPLAHMKNKIISREEIKKYEIKNKKIYKKISIKNYFFRGSGMRILVDFLYASNHFLFARDDSSIGMPVMNMMI